MARTLVIKLVIFDFDGTLVDTSLDIMVAVNRLLKNFNLPQLTFDEVKRHIGEGFTPFIRSVARSRKVDDLKFEEEVFSLFQKLYDEKLVEKTKFYEGAEEFLKEIQKSQNIKVGIISNKPEYQVRIILKSFNISEKNLVQIYGGDTFKLKKPHPFPLQEMMSLAGVKPSETVMIGDSQADVDAAKAAGTHFIAVSFGYNTIDALKNFGADNFIHHFDELLQALGSLGAQVG